MAQPANIEHKGIIEGIDDTYVYVKIQAHAACGGCQAKSICNLTEVEHKVIEVKRLKDRDYAIGQEVTVVLMRSLGFRAVVLGYLIPFCILMITLLISLSVFEHEASAGLASILLLIPYYAVLYKYKDRLKDTFDFKIQ